MSKNLLLKAPFPPLPGTSHGRFAAKTIQALLRDGEEMWDHTAR
jgi:hypothetical protein